MGRACSTYGKSKGTYTVLVGNLREKDRRPRRRCEDNNKMEIQKVGSEGMDWIDLAQHTDS